MKKNTLKNKDKKYKKIKNIALAFSAIGAISAPFIVQNTFNKNSNQNSSIILNSNKSLEYNHLNQSYEFNSLPNLDLKLRYDSVQYRLQQKIDQGFWLNPNKTHVEKIVYSVEQKGDNDTQDARNWANGRSQITIAEWRARGREVIYWPTLKRAGFLNTQINEKREIINGDGSLIDVSSSVEIIQKPSRTYNNGELVINLNDFNPNNYFVSVVNVMDQPVAKVEASYDQIKIKNYSNSENGLRVMLSPRNYYQKAVSRGTDEHELLPNNINKVFVLPSNLINNNEFLSQQSTNMRFSVDQDANSKLFLANENEANGLIETSNPLIDDKTKNIIKEIASTNDQKNFDWIRSTPLSYRVGFVSDIKYVGKYNDHSFYLYSSGDEERFHKLLRINNTDSRIGISSMTDDEKQAFVKPYDFHIYMTNHPLYNKISSIPWNISAREIKDIMFASFEAAKLKMNELIYLSTNFGYVFDQTVSNIINNITKMINFNNEFSNLFPLDILAAEELKNKVSNINTQNNRYLTSVLVNDQVILNEAENIYKDIEKNLKIFFNSLREFRYLHNEYKEWRAINPTLDIEDAFEADHTLDSYLTIPQNAPSDHFTYSFNQINQIYMNALSIINQINNGIFQEKINNIQNAKSNYEFLLQWKSQLIKDIENTILDWTSYFPT